MQYITPIVELLLAGLAAVLAMLIHEVPKYYTHLIYMHPIHRKRDDRKIPMSQFIDPIGLVLFMFTNIGWQKPGEYNPGHYKDKEKALLPVNIVGLVFSLLFATAGAMMVRFVFVSTISAPVYVEWLGQFLVFFVQFNFTLFVVNLLPVPPFGMSKIIYSFSPNTYFKMIQNERLFHAGFILLIVFNVIGVFVRALYVPFINMFL